MRFPVFHKKDSAGVPADFSFLGTDLHSHLIPGIDDGSPDLDTSVSLIKGLHQLGYTKIITTPHVKQAFFANDPSTILPGLEQVRAAIGAAGIPVELSAAAEHFLDAGLIEAIRENQRLLTLSANKLLVEISFIGPPMQLHEFLYELQVKGYHPVVAHPERYRYYHNDEQQYQKLIDQGCQLQLNLLSLAGHYGKDVRKAAFRLLDKQQVSYLGTDLHHERHLEMMRQMLKDRSLMRRLAEYPWKNREL